jgi:hypothetical protein
MDIHIKYIRILRTRGKTKAIEYIKTLRADVYKLLSLSSSGEFFKETKIIVHKDLLFLKSKRSYGVPFLKLLLTVLSASRILRSEVSPDISTITGPSKLKKYPFSSLDFREFWIALGYKKVGEIKTSVPKFVSFKSYHKTTNTGPNGQALFYCIEDLNLLYNNHPDVLKDLLFIGGSKLQDVITNILHFIEPILVFLRNSIYYKHNNRQLCIRRISCFPEKEGKTRVVAIFDYFSQTSLRPLHNYLFKVLKKIPQDYTFNQTGFLDTIGNQEVYYSIDLTAFTDRFPILVNRDLLASRFGILYANSWKRIMTVPLLYNGQLISYSTGNPMGAYSSWNSTALSHHFIVWKSCKNLGIDWSTLPYALLGDDIVICHKAVALEYCRLIRTIGVQWNNSKTHVSPHFFEFAKRIYWNDSDLTPFPLPGLYAEHKTVSGFTQIMLNASSKGFGTAETLLDSFEQFLSLYKKPRRLRRKLITWGQEMLVISSVIQGKSSAGRIRPFLESISPSLSSLSDEVMHNIVSHCVMIMFSESCSKLLDKGNKKPLGVFPEVFTIFLTSLTVKESVEPSYNKIIPSNYTIRKDPCEIINDLPQSIPLTFVWGLITERYILSTQRALKIDLNGGDWDLVFNDLLIPKSDHDVFSSRSSPTIFKTSGRIFILIKEQIKTLLAYPNLM